MGSKNLSLESGNKLSANEAKAYADEIIARMYARWEKAVFSGPFMRELEAGKLPMKTIRLFWKHW